MSGYYPAGAEFDSRAPFNQIEEDCEFCIDGTICSECYHNRISCRCDDYEEITCPTCDGDQTIIKQR